MTTEMPKLMRSSNMLLQPQLYTIRAVTVPDNHTVEDCLHPSYLSPRRSSLREMDIIEFLHERGDWELQVRIISISEDTNQVTVRPIRYLDADSDIGLPAAKVKAVMETARIGTYNYGGPSVKHRILVDGEVVRDKFATQDEARKWAADNNIDLPKPEKAVA